MEVTPVALHSAEAVPQEAPAPTEGATPPSNSQAAPDSPSGGDAASDTSEDEYDPESAHLAPAAPAPGSELDSEYDPEESLPQAPPAPPAVKPMARPSLPPKPPTKVVKGALVPTSAAISLEDAMQKIMQSDAIRDPSFVKLSQAEQMKVIQDQLSRHNVKLPASAPAAASSAKGHYDQVYLYNKPFKHVKDRIPLVPVNEFCLRPNISVPMTPEEEAQYNEFLATETRYSNQNNWDGFPDGLRLFIGNLPANTITKQDLWRIFNLYGEVVQVVIKAGYGFVQFRTAEACLRCIKGETGVPLHNKILRLDASRPSKKDAGSPVVSRGRERVAEETEADSKRQKTGTPPTPAVDAAESGDEEPECYIYITSDSQSLMVKKCNEVFSNSLIVFEFEDVTDLDISEVISDAAYTGIMGACVVKGNKIDLQTFESAPDGGVKFDEYADIEPDVAVDILSKFKAKKAPKSALPAVPPVALPAVPKPSKEAVSQSKPDRHHVKSSQANSRHRATRNTRPADNNSHHRNNNRHGLPVPRAPYQPQYAQYAPPLPVYNLGVGQYGAPQPQLPPPGYGMRPYNYAPPGVAPAQSPYGVPYPPQPHHQPVMMPPATVDPNSQLVQTLQNMDPASMQNMIAFLQQQSSPHGGLSQPAHPPTAYGAAPMANAPVYSNPAPPLPAGYGLPASSQGPPPPRSQLDSLLSHLKTNPPNSLSSSELMETLRRLGKR
jgi:nuclear polyadenylated RNA-binding protein 3